MGYLGIDNDSNASSEISTDTTNFDHILSVADDTVQKALDTIDDNAVTDHGSLSGLSDDDHPQYALADGTRLLVSTDTTLTGAGTVSDPLSAEPYVTSTAITYALIFG